jgi:hypothetical protein
VEGERRGGAWKDEEGEDEKNLAETNLHFGNNFSISPPFHPYPHILRVALESV